jgi:CubicO group peptidase (beta-lactamase class C family)
MLRQLAFATALLLLSSHLVLCAQAIGQAAHLRKQKTAVRMHEERHGPPRMQQNQRKHMNTDMRMQAQQGSTPPLGDPSSCTFPVPTYSLVLPDPLPEALRDALQRADQRIAELFASNGTAGMHVSVVYDQQVVFSRGYGQVHLDTGAASSSSAAATSPAPNENTIFRVGSLTKLFTVLMMFHLRDQHRLSLETELKALLPNYHTPNPWQTRRGITLRMVG